MPSWRTHCRLGRIICFGFCSEEIDAYIDNMRRHDAGRYDRNIFVNEALSILKKYGGNGLCYYILHHVLDRLQDLLVSELAQGYDDYVRGRSIDEIYESIRTRILERLRYDPKTVIPEFLEETYESRSLEEAHRQAQDPVTEMFLRFVERLRQLDREVRGLPSEGPEIEILRAMTRLVLIGIEFSLDCVLYMLITDVSSSGKPTTGSRAYWAIFNKEFARSYKAGSTCVNNDSIVRYLTEIVEPARKRCEKFDKRAQEMFEKVVKELTGIFEILNKYGVKLYIRTPRSRIRNRTSN